MAIASQQFPMDEVLNALLECLVDPWLTKLIPMASSDVGEGNIAKQMEAVTMLYNHYLCQDLPNLGSLDWHTFCKKAIVLRIRLLKFMRVTKEGDSKLTLTETKVKKACETIETLRNSKNDLERLPVTKVCICLLNVRLDKCVLVFGSGTLGVWSFIEKSKDLDTGAKSAVEGSHFSGSEEELAFLAVEEQTGIKSSVLKVEDCFMVQECTNQCGGSTKFFIMSCYGTFDLSPTMKLEKVVWVPVETALSSSNGPLVATMGSSMCTTSAVEYFRLRPFRPLVKNWFMRHSSTIKSGNKDLIKKGSNLKSVHKDWSTMEAAANGIHSKADQLMETDKSNIIVPSSQQTSVGLALDGLRQSIGNDRSICVNKFTQIEMKGNVVLSNQENCVSPDLISNDKSICAHAGTQHLKEVGASGNTITSNIAGSNGSVNLESIETERMEETVLSAEALKEVKYERSACTLKPEELVEEEARLSIQNVDGMGSDLGFCGANPTPESSIHRRARKELDEAGAFLSKKSALRIIKKRRKVVSKELIDLIADHQSRMDYLHKQIDLIADYESRMDFLKKLLTECDADMMTLVAGGKPSLQLALKICKKDCQKQRVSSDVSLDQQEKISTDSHVVDQGETNTKRRCLSKESFQMPKSSIQELSEVCMKNDWPLPSYEILTIQSQQKQILYSGKVKIRGIKFDLSVPGELKDSVKAATASAASSMLSTLSLIKMSAPKDLSVNSMSQGLAMNSEYRDSQNKRWHYG